MRTSAILLTTATLVLLPFSASGEHLVSAGLTAGGIRSTLGFRISYDLIDLYQGLGFGVDLEYGGYGSVDSLFSELRPLSLALKYQVPLREGQIFAGPFVKAGTRLNNRQTMRNDLYAATGGALRGYVGNRMFVEYQGGLEWFDGYSRMGNGVHGYGSITAGFTIGNSGISSEWSDRSKALNSLWFLGPPVAAILSVPIVVLGISLLWSAKD